MAFFKNKLAVTIIVLSVSFLAIIGYSVKRDKASIGESGVGATINSVQKYVYKAGSSIKEFGSFVFNFSKIKNENESLKKENDELQNKALEYDSILKENQRLSEMLDFKNQRSEYKYKGCSIISTSGGGILDGLTINRGTKDGITKGLVVITAKGLVGQVTSVASNWSIVQTLSNENIAVSGMIASSDAGNGDNGIVRGYKDSDNNSLAKLYYLPEQSKVKKGDVIVTSGRGRIYPKGIRIGTVTDIEEDKGKVMKNAVIQPSVDFNKLEEVFVVIPTEKDGY